MHVRMSNVYAVVNGFTQVEETDPVGVILTRHLITRWTTDVQLTESHTDGAVVFETWRDVDDPDIENPLVFILILTTRYLNLDIL